MKFRMDKELKFWVDVEYQAMKVRGYKVHRNELVTSILAQFEGCGDALRYRDANGATAWKATPKMLARLADAEREVQNDLADIES